MDVEKRKDQNRMNLSDVLYETACLFSNLQLACSCHTCCAILEVSDDSQDAIDGYKEIMETDNFTQATDAAARAVGWDQLDYRTFMLLMASEAAKS